jgi:hypothetical protein
LKEQLDTVLGAPGVGEPSLGETSSRR